jgi:hypothetical protein
MPKTLTKLQERIVARVLAEPAQTLYLREGHVNSTKNMIQKGLIDEHCYMMLQYSHLTPEVKSIFFQENDVVFAIQDIYDNCWIVFEDRNVVAKPRNEDSAKRIVLALKGLREIVSPLSRMDTPTDKAKNEDHAEEILADLDDERLCSDSSALYELIREARKLAA